MRGKFITVEGPDGAGKSSVVKGLKPLLEEYTNQSIIVTREPGGSVIAEEIRSLLLNPEHKKMDDRTEALLYAASRRQHVMEKILPALNEGKIVLCDRFVDSSLAYQGNARGIGIENVWKINKFAIEDLKPDITIYLEVDAETGLNRIQHVKSNRTKDRLELEEIAFHQKVQEGYEKIIQKQSSRFLRIDASLPQEDVLKNTWAKLNKRLAKL